jgi:hypothetical protein
LIDAETGALRWANPFDGSLGIVSDLQDRVAASVVGVIEPTLQAAETASSAARPTAFDLYSSRLCDVLLVGAAYPGGAPPNGVGDSPRPALRAVLLPSRSVTF